MTAGRTFPVEEFLATPGSRCIRLRVGPRVEDAVEIDQLLFEARKQEVYDFCLDIPDAEGMSWRLLRPYVGDNGLMAKLLIALGELAGAWAMHPSPDHPELWSSTMYPMVFGRKIRVVPRMPKPSAGDLEKDLESCSCCERPMGPPDSIVHDLLASPAKQWLCLECEDAECPGDGVCYLDGKPKQAQARPEAEGEELDGSIEAASGFEDYLKGFS